MGTTLRGGMAVRSGLYTMELVKTIGKTILKIGDKRTVAALGDAETSSTAAPSSGPPPREEETAGETCEDSTEKENEEEQVPAEWSVGERPTAAQRAAHEATQVPYAGW